MVRFLSFRACALIRRLEDAPPVAFSLIHVPDGSSLQRLRRVDMWISPAATFVWHGASRHKSPVPSLSVWTKILARATRFSTHSHPESPRLAICKNSSKNLELFHAVTAIPTDKQTDRLLLTVFSLSKTLVTRLLDLVTRPLDFLLICVMH